MIGGLEAGPTGQRLHETTDRCLRFGVDVNILDCAASLAHHVVMVPRQPFGQLESGHALRVVMAVHHTGFVEDRQRPVERGEGNIPDTRRQLGRRPRPGLETHGPDNRLAATGVPNIVLGQTASDGLVELPGF